MDALDDLRSVRSTWRREVRTSPLVRSVVGGSALRKDESPPSLYLRECGRSAAKRWERTLAWRKAQNIDGILDEAHPDFAAIRAAYPHFIYGRSATGDAVVVEFLGKLDVSQLPRTADVGRHFALVHEVLSRRFDGEDTRLVSVLDVRGLEWSNLFSARALDLLKSAATVQENLVPFRARAILVANAPAWFAAAFHLLPLPNSIRSKVRLVDDFAGIFPKGGLPSVDDLLARPDDRALVRAAKMPHVNKASLRPSADTFDEAGGLTDDDDEDHDDAAAAEESDDDDAYLDARAPPDLVIDDDGEFFDARDRHPGYILYGDDAESETTSLDGRTDTWWYERLFA